MRLTRLELVVLEGPVLVPELHPDPAPELDLPAPLARVLLVLHDRLPALAGRGQHLAHLQVGGVGHAARLGHDAALLAALEGVDVGRVEADPALLVGVGLVGGEWAHGGRRRAVGVVLGVRRRGHGDLQGERGREEQTADGDFVF